MHLAHADVHMYIAGEIVPIPTGDRAGHRLGCFDGAPRLHIADSCPEKARIGRAGMDGKDGGGARGTCDVMTASSVSRVLMLCGMPGRIELPVWP